MNNLPEWLQELWEISPRIARKAENDFNTIIENCKSLKEIVENLSKNKNCNKEGEKMIKSKNSKLNIENFKKCYNKRLNDFCVAAKEFEVFPVQSTWMILIEKRNILKKYIIACQLIEKNIKNRNHKKELKKIVKNFDNIINKFYRIMMAKYKIINEDEN